MGEKTRPGCLPKLRAQLGKLRQLEFTVLEREESHSERMLGIPRRPSLNIQFSTHQHMHMKELEDGKGHLERIGRNSAQNLPRQGIVLILTARVENFII